jgi:hypothetical protein
MEFLDPRVAVIAGVGGALLGSERVRHVVGQGVGYAAKGVMAVGAPVVRPVVSAGEDIVSEARHTAAGSNGRQRPRSRTKASSS